jgi:hypothetical protein
MNLRPTAEVHHAFSVVADALDADLRLSHVTLNEKRISIINHCNRSGFDPTGYGWPRWSYRFERRSESVSPLCLLALVVTYEEPIDPARQARLQCEAVADVFHLGASISFFKYKQLLPLDISAFTGGHLTETVDHALRDTAGQVPADYCHLLEQLAPAVNVPTNLDLLFA